MIFAFRHSLRKSILAVAIAAGVFFPFGSGARVQLLGLNPPLHYYLTEAPVEFVSDMGEFWRKAHYAYEAGGKALTFWGVYKFNPHAGWSYLAHTPFTAYPAIRLQSTAHLEAIDGATIREKVYELSQIKGVRSILAVKGSETEKDSLNLVSTRRENKVVYLIEAEKPIDEEARAAGLGKLREIGDLKRTRISFRLSLPDRSSPLKWEPSLLDLMNEEKIPLEVSVGWRETFRDYRKKIKSLRPPALGVKEKTERAAKAVKAYMTGENYEGMKIQSFLMDESGAEKELGTLVEDEGAAKTIGLGEWSWIKGKSAELANKLMDKVAARAPNIVPSHRFPPVSAKIKSMNYQADEDGAIQFGRHCVRSSMVRMFSGISAPK